MYEYFLTINNHIARPIYDDGEKPYQMMKCIAEMLADEITYTEDAPQDRNSSLPYRTSYKIENGRRYKYIRFKSKALDKLMLKCTNDNYLLCYIVDIIYKGSNKWIYLGCKIMK